MVSFEIFVKLMPPNLSELKVLPSFCFAFKIPDNVAVTNSYIMRKKSVMPWVYFFTLGEIEVSFSNGQKCLKKSAYVICG